MICPRCKEVMKSAMHFEQGKSSQFKECPKCHEKTRPKRIHFEDILSDKLNEIKQKRTLTK
jgi:NAD-dependent SIR2 family protein deacetylase